MRGNNGENGPLLLLKFLTNDDSVFRYAVLYSPLITGLGMFLLYKFIRRKDFFESLGAAAIIFLCLCLFGLAYEASKRRNSR